jgi:integrase
MNELTIHGNIAAEPRIGYSANGTPHLKFSVAVNNRREHAGTEWQEGDWMFAQPNGRPIRPEQDRQEWLQLLDDAGVQEARLHDARHTAATVLLLLGVKERVAMELMG